MNQKTLEKNASRIDTVVSLIQNYMTISDRIDQTALNMGVSKEKAMNLIHVEQQDSALTALGILESIIKK